MPAPRTPGGTPLEDGYQAMHVFEDDTDIALYEIAVKPPGLDGGEKIDQTTQHNEEVRTFAPRSLTTMTDAATTCAYDPAALADILALINEPQLIKTYFPDGGFYSYYGYLRSFEPAELVEGTRPTAQVVIAVTNVDPSDGSEHTPTYTAPS